MEREEMAEMFDVVVETCISDNKVYDVCYINEHKEIRNEKNREEN